MCENKLIELVFHRNSEFSELPKVIKISNGLRILPIVTKLINSWIKKMYHAKFNEYIRDLFKIDGDICIKKTITINWMQVPVKIRWQYNYLIKTLKLISQAIPCSMRNTIVLNTK